MTTTLACGWSTAARWGTGASLGVVALCLIVSIAMWRRATQRRLRGLTLPGGDVAVLLNGSGGPCTKRIRRIVQWSGMFFAIDVAAPRRIYVIFNDALNAEDARRLRVQLRCIQRGVHWLAPH